MLGTVALSPRRLEEYEALIGPERVAELRRLAEPLRGLHLLALSLRSFGSWTTDLLTSSVPLLRDLGIDAAWQVVQTDHESQGALVALYEGLNGAGDTWTAETRRAWLRAVADAGRSLSGGWDTVIVHDPQLIGMIDEGQSQASGARWIWNCHTDLSASAADAWSDLSPSAAGFDATMLEDPSFSPPGWQARLVQVIAPGIDPLGPRNVPLDAETVELLAGKLGIDARRPLIAQIAPFDVGADALGLIEVYDELLHRFPDLQLAIIPTSLRDDQETRGYFNAVARLANERPSCILPSLAAEIGNAEINACRHAASIVVQKSLRRGFALWLSEAMWQRRPVVAGRTVGTTAQVVDGVTGFLVPTTTVSSDRIADLLADAALRERMGENGRRHVANHFLITRYLADTLQLLRRVVSVGVSA
ncbi:MAG TPA: glycosyltransferase [Dehalococcoidia bacterium]|nr:glycosyltransferase [Dehalococcoidia bacterium]